MLPYVAAYAGSLFVFLGLDALWLSLMGPKLYKPLLQGLLAQSVRPAPAVLFYAIYGLGILLLAVAPWSQPERLAGAVMRGALLGLVSYATYDLTNQATLRSWPAVITLADLGWGMILTATAAGLGFIIWRWISQLMT